MKPWQNFKRQRSQDISFGSFVLPLTVSVKVLGSREWKRLGIPFFCLGTQAVFGYY